MNKKTKGTIASVIAGLGVLAAIFLPNTNELSWIPEGGWGVIETTYTTGKGTDTLKTWTTKKRFEGKQEVNSTVSDTITVDTIK